MLHLMGYESCTECGEVYKEEDQCSCLKEKDDE